AQPTNPPCDMARAKTATLPMELLKPFSISRRKRGSLLVGHNPPGRRLVLTGSNDCGDFIISIFFLVSPRTWWMQQSKSQRIRDALEGNDWVAALRLASRFHDRSSDTVMFKRGFDAYHHPGFYRQLGKDPDQLVTTAVALLRRRFGPAN